MDALTESMMFLELDVAEDEAEPQAVSARLSAPADASGAPSASPCPASASAAPCPAAPETDPSADESTCAICLSAIAPEDLALLPGCDHVYCAPCLLRWAAHALEPRALPAPPVPPVPRCPQCKVPFESLMTYRGLDGRSLDFPEENS
ncbi:hypothetical protein H632_c3960p0, partial [Helicosporidium sp. ATCC 50920]